MKELPELATFVKKDGTIEFFDNAEEMSYYKDNDNNKLKAEITGRPIDHYLLSLYDRQNLQGTPYISSGNIDSYTQSGAFYLLLPNLKDLYINNIISSFRLRIGRIDYSSSNDFPYAKTVVILSFFELYNFNGQSLTYEFYDNTRTFSVNKLQDVGWDNRTSSIKMAIY